MYYRTTFRLGEGIDRIMGWVMRVKISTVNLSRLLAVIWLAFIAIRVPEAFGLFAEAIAMREITNEVVPVKKPVPRMHGSFVSETVARRYGPPMQYPKQ